MSSVSNSASPMGAEGGSGSTSAADLSNVEINEATTVPEVEVKHAPFQSQPSLRGEMTEEQLKELGDKMRKEKAKKYFSLRKDAFANAVEDCKSYLDESDGEILSSWLLCEIDHWDHEKERIVLITKKTLCLVKYNFSGLKFDGVRKVPLIECNKIQIGRFVYPKTTIMMITGYLDNSPRSKQSGLRIFCSSQEPGFFQKWNPWYDEMPYISLTSHVQSVLVESPPEAVQHSLFSRALIDAITNARETEPNKEILNGFEVVEAELEICVYTGLSAKIYNQSKLGFYKHRGSFLF